MNQRYCAGSGASGPATNVRGRCPNEPGAFRRLLGPPAFAATSRFGMVVGERSGEVLMKRKLATIVLVGVVFGLGAVAVTAAGAANSTTTTTTTHCANPAPTPTTTRCR